MAGGLESRSGALSIEPMLAVSTPKPFNSPERIFAVKWGGTRAIAALPGGTLRIPTPEGTIEASGEADQGEFILEGGRLAATMPLHPGVNVVVTQYLVGYDRDRDSYRVRATAPLPGERIEVRVPERFVRSARPDSNGRRAGAPGTGGARGRAFARGGTERRGASVRVGAPVAPARAGGGLSGDLGGLSGETASTPRTGRGGALVGGLLALLVLGVAAVAIARSPLARRVEEVSESGAESEREP